MKQFVALRRTRVNDGYEHLPRPRLTQDVLYIGSHEECHDVINEMAKEPKNWSTEEIEVSLVVVKYDGHKTLTSTSFRQPAYWRNKK